MAVNSPEALRQDKIELTFVGVRKLDKASKICAYFTNFI